MQMGMMLEVLAPGVQQGGDADVGAEVPGIGRNGGERIGCGSEQQSVDLGLVLVGDGTEGGRQREHHVEARHRQQFGFARLKPRLRGWPLALRAVPVAAANGRRPLPVLWANSVMGSWRRLDRALVPAAANPAHHYEGRLRSAISLSDGWNAPRRRCGGTIDSIASSFSVGSPRV